MKFFNYLDLFNSIENYRLANGQKFIKFLNYLLNKINKILTKIFNDNFYVILFSIGIALFSILVRFFHDNFQSNVLDSFEFINQEDNRLLMIELITKYQAKFCQKFQINTFIFYEIWYNIFGLIAILIANKILKKSIIKDNQFSINIIVLSYSMIYFIGFRFNDSSHLINYFSALLIIFNSLILQKNLNNYFASVAIAIIGCLFFFIKWQFIFFYLGFEFLIFFIYRRFDFQKNINWQILRLLIFILVFFILKDFLVFGSLKQIIFNDLSKIEFINHKYFGNNLLNDLYLANTSIGLSRFFFKEIWLFFMAFFCLNFYKLSSNNSDNLSFKELYYFFWFNYIISILILVFSTKTNNENKSIFYLINFIFISYLFLILFTKSFINYKRHGFAIIVIISIAFSDHYNFFKIFFSFPFFWFIFLAINQIKKPLVKINEKNFSIYQKFLLKFNRQSLFLILIYSIAYILFIINSSFLISFIIGSILLCLVVKGLIFIDHEVRNYDHVNYFVWLIILANFIFLFGNMLSGLGLIKSYGNYASIFSQNSMVNYLRVDLKNQLNNDSIMLNISKEDHFFNNFYSLIYPNEITKKIIHNTKTIEIVKQNNVKFLAFNNNFKLSNKACFLSDFEIIIQDKDFKKYLNSNFIFYKNYQYFINHDNQINFFNNNDDFAKIPNNFIIYDIILFKKI